MEKKKYIDCCKTLTILKQDSGLLEKPYDSWNTFTPKKGDLAYVDEDDSEYEFNGKNWVLKNSNITDMIDKEEGWTIHGYKGI